MDYAEAAALMGTTEQNARIRVSRALKALSLRLQGISRICHSTAFAFGRRGGKGREGGPVWASLTVVK